MSKLYKLTALLFALVLMLTALAPSETAQAADLNKVTNLTIHKIKGENARTATYDELNGTPPANVEKISNIKFTYWKVTKEQYDAMMKDQAKYTTVEQMTAYMGTAGQTTGATDAEGKTIINGLVEGHYWFVENKSTAVVKSAAVPFGLALPITNQSGDAYITDLHVYPKNTLAPTPEIEMNVGESKDATGDDSVSVDIGEDVIWNIKPTVPKGIEEYQKYEISSEINKNLDFDGSSVVVTYNGIAMTPGTDYELSFDPNTLILKVVFLQAGLDKLGKVWNDTGVAPLLNIAVTTQINQGAAMGQDITNTVTLSFDNGHGVASDASNPVTVGTVPKVYIGGKKFVKTDGATEKLAGAEFVVMKNGTEEYLKQDTDMKVTWVTDQSAATKFISDANGAFEVKGLSYGSKGDDNTGSRLYTLKEIKAPKGYVLPTDPNTDFTINATSYTSDVQNIINKKVTIPDTGGMGTILFTVVGLALMVFALVLIGRRRKQAE
ncbi:SpaH/EbpB family LPXTG-anchored major pilin [Salinicoccus sp. ID82-1]|uniref:SpaH/EbpB family LPXTG-anchored major pilin n=1 Tax=Salinicoccus sp. ID82-1 TaxID=2820269 RepID=UPI001F4698F2|nr:SpaH/EbpB family LPXTG-anchored major pilin [Salinicoccus sp. ID82-1]MCG1009619.1 SpaH/EbpB family LPXTG-anchored major pilin [Salinicoccus sp. ID82-1]